MCENCEKEDSGYYCQDCGRALCDDMKGGDDVYAAPYVTASGDLFCVFCGPAYDDEEEYDEYDLFDPYDDMYEDDYEGEES